MAVFTARTAGVAAGIGLLAGIALLGTVEALSRSWSCLSAYNQGLPGVGITHEFVSLLLIVFVAGFLAAYSVDAPLWRTRIFSAALTGFVAMVTARVLLFIPNPVYLVHSLLATWAQCLLLVGGAMLVAAFGGAVASFLEKGRARDRGNLLPVATIVLLVVAAPPLLAAAGTAAGVIPHVPYSCGQPAAETDVRVIKVSAAGDIEWDARADIGPYDTPGVLTEYRDGYALAVTEYCREGNTVQILLYDERGNARGRSTIETGFGRITAFVPAPDGGFVLATEGPEILCVDAGGAVLWEQSLVDESRGMAAVSLLSESDDRYVAVWEDTAACYSGNGTLVWRAPLAGMGGVGYHSISPASGGGVLVVSEGRNVFAGDHFEVFLQAIRLDRNGTVLWTRDFGSEGTDELLDARETAPGRFGLLYRSTTFPKDLWGGVAPAYQGYSFSLDENGDVAEFHAVEDDGGVVIPSSGGSLSVVGDEARITLVGRDIAGNEVWRRERAIDMDLHSLRGIGTADGGYVIAGSTDA